MDFAKRRENYLIAVYILLPTFLLALLILLLYIYCSKRFKLNWYEKTLLEEHDRHTTIDKNCASVSVDTVNSNSSLTTPLIHNTTGSKGVTTTNTSINIQCSNPAALLIKPTVSTTCSVSSEKRDSKGSLIAEWLPGNIRMGSSPSSPVRDVSQKFWVPPAVIERKRAQSLVPSLTQIDSDDDQSSGTVTPSSMSGAREPSFSFPGDSRGSVTSNDIPFIPGQRPRRASMQDAIDLKKIDTKLYDRKLLRQQSLSSGEEENLGAVNCSLHYNKETHLLAVNIIQAVDLVPKDFSGMANPYCKVSLLPVHRSQLQTKVHHKTLDPKFDEEFIFDVSPQKLKSCVLEILLFDFDQFSRHECVGQVKLILENIDLTEKVDLWKGISHYEKQKSKDQRDIGDVMFSLSYLSSAERLTVVIIKARNLRHSEDGKNTDSKTADPFVKVSVILKGRKIKKKKTSTVHSSLNPVWNEALSFSITRDIVKDVSLELTVCHENKLGNDDILGHVRLSVDSDGDERVHWNDLVSFRSAVARWHTLL